MGNEKVVAIIQARLGSTRLPLKSLLSLGNLPVIDWLLYRLGKARQVDEIIVAIPNTPLDSILRDHLQKRRTHCFAGSENDVLARMTQAARSAEATTVLRICADNPLLDPEAIDELIDFYNETSPDYAYNHVPRGNLWPDGLGCEILSRDLLEQIEKQATLPAQREHCLNYIVDNPAKFTIGTFDPPRPALRRPEIKLDLDSVTDYQRLCALKAHPDIKAEEIIQAWDKAFGNSGQTAPL